jgi:dihydropteroate synthase
MAMADALGLVGRRTLVMGVLNCTPDSFYDGGRYARDEAALTQGHRLVEDGADIIDVGGESSRPGAEPVLPEVEWRRIAPAVDSLAVAGAAISVDTYHADTAWRAVTAGAGMINDITALQGDPAMADVVAEAGCAVVLMHMQGTPETMQRHPRYNDVVDDITAFLEARIAFAVERGIREDRIWVDPGFGFGKSVEHNLEVLRRLGAFRRLGRPVLIGTSNKSTIGKVLDDAPPDARDDGTAATVAVAIAHGADAVRVHNVGTMTRVARMADAIMGRGDHG